ncbi:hypothetical protein E3N88_36342 [Mikania micrantha]|uniref:Uncharacterized protein n=1 Tax=Mikania micrantha TaxID=192012 RepID=A0A5N6M3V3_9ASTR|nr:hypothetical protein E3N88_36342 [Mikania micrantha]
MGDWIKVQKKGKGKDVLDNRVCDLQTKNTKKELSFKDYAYSHGTMEYNGCKRTTNALKLGSCIIVIHPLLASIETSREACTHITTSHANAFRSKIFSLKSKLTTNPIGSHTGVEFLRGIHLITDEHELASQSPINDEDLIDHFINQLGLEFESIVATIKVQENLLTILNSMRN